MHWLFFILAAIAFIALGAMSVWISVLALALKVMLLGAVAFALYLIWQHFFGRKS